MKAIKKIIPWLILITMFISLLYYVSGGFITQITIVGHVKGPGKINALVNLSGYETGTSTLRDFKTTTVNENGDFIRALTWDTDYGNADVVINISSGVIKGSHILINVPYGGSPIEVNMTIHTNLTLDLPPDNEQLNNNTPFLNWSYPDYSYINYTIYIDDDSDFSSPVFIKNTSITSYTLNSSEALGDGIYYWKVESYDGITLIDTSSISHLLHIDTTSPEILSVSPQNNTWYNHSSIYVQITKNESGICRWDYDSLINFSDKQYQMDGNETTSTDTILLTYEGNNSIFIQCNDSYGNQMNLTDEYGLFLNLDNNTPITDDNYTLSNLWTNQNATIGLNFSDPSVTSGINWTRYCTGAPCNPISGTDYTVPVEYSEGITFFRYASFDNAENLETTNEIIIKIDQTSPNTTDDFSFNNTWINVSINISLTESDPSLSSGLNWTRYCAGLIDCTPSILYTEPIEISDENITYLRYHSQDNVSNTQTIKTLIIKKDNNTPLTIANFTFNDTWISSNASITLNVSDPGITSGINWTRYCIGVACIPDSGTDYTIPINFTQGTSYLRYATKDNALNVEKTKEMIIKIDQTTPTTFDDFTYNDTWINFSINISLTEQDLGTSSGINWTKYCVGPIDCTPDTDYTTPIEFTVENVTYLRYHSQDNVSHTQSIKTLIVKIDKTLPITTNNFTFNNTWIRTNVSIVLNVSDLGITSGINWTKYCLGQSCQPITGADYTIPLNFSEGITYLRYASKDNASNNEATNELIIKIDQSYPNTSDDFIYNDTWINSSINITLTPSDPENSSGINWTRYCTGLVDCSPSTPYTTPIEISQENITYVRYHSQDNVSNTQQIITLIVKIDKSAPSMTSASVVIENAATYSTSSSLNVSWSGFDDNLSGINYYYFNYTNSTIGFIAPQTSAIINNSAEGNITVYVWARDDVGNIGLYANDTIIVDTISPVVLNTSSNNITEKYADNVTINVTITEVTSGVNTSMLRYKYGNDTFSNYTLMTLVSGNNYTITLPKPDWNLYRLQNITWQFNITDMAGNSNISSYYFEYIETINDPPILDFIPDTGSLAFGSIVFNITASDPDNDGIENQTLTYTSNETNLTITRINNTLAQVTWTPDNNFVGDNYINFVVTDDGTPSLSDNQTITITVLFVNEPPILHLIGNRSIFENETFEIQINATEPNNQTLTFYDNTTLFNINSSTGLINFTPNSTLVGNYSINISIRDILNAEDSEIIILEILNVQNNLTFNVRDRINQTLLDDITITGGVVCAFGCTFNESISFIEQNGIFTYNFSRTEFQDNITLLSAFNDTTVDITLNDITSPNITSVNITFETTQDLENFNIIVYANASDNFQMQNVSFNYSMSQGLDQTQIVTLSDQENDMIFNLTLGPFNQSFFLVSQVIARDIYGNEFIVNNTNVQVIFVNGVARGNRPPVLEYIGPRFVQIGSNFNIQLNATDPDNNNITFADNATFFNINRTTGMINFTANSSHEGVHQINITVSDGNLTDTEIFTLTIDYGSNLTFVVRDRLLNVSLSDVTLTGGYYCRGGCLFNNSINFIEKSGISEYNFTRSGFVLNSSIFNINSNITLNITLDDNVPPSLNDLNITARLTDNNQSYYIDFTVNATDNFNMSVINLTYGADESPNTTVSLIHIENTSLYNVSLGPYNSTIVLYSELVGFDNYLSNFTEETVRQFFYYLGNVDVLTNPYVTIHKSITYINQTLVTVNYLVTDTIVNIGNANLSGINLTDIEINQSPILFNLTKSGTYTINNTVTINKTLNSSVHIFNFANATILGENYSSNVPSVLVPGYGKPLELNVTGRVSSNNMTYYIDIIANATEFSTFIQNVTLQYGFNSSMLNSTIPDNNSTIYNVTLGPFNVTKYLHSRFIITDIYGTNITQINPIKQFFFSTSGVNVSNFPYLVITKNVYYLNQSLSDINYFIEDTIFNTAGADLYNIQFRDLDKNSSYIYFNLTQGDSYVINYTITISKNASSIIKTFVAASSTVQGYDYYSNIPRVLIPGYGGPFDITVNVDSSVPASGSIIADIELINQNLDTGQDAIVNYQIDDGNGTVYSSGSNTVYVPANSTVNTTGNLTAPSSSGNYVFRANISYPQGVDPVASDSFIVLAATCNDGVLNGVETGVDCGGICAACSVSPPPSSGGGGGGGSYTPVIEYVNVTTNATTILQPLQSTIYVDYEQETIRILDQKLKDEVSGVQGTTFEYTLVTKDGILTIHHIRIIQIDETVSFEFYPDYFERTIPTSIRKNIDSNLDDKYDISILIDKIENNRAFITFERVWPLEPVNISTESPQQVITPVTVTKKDRSYLIFIILCIIILLLTIMNYIGRTVSIEQVKTQISMMSEKIEDISWKEKLRNKQEKTTLVKPEKKTSVKTQHEDINQNISNLQKTIKDSSLPEAVKIYDDIDKELLAIQNDIRTIKGEDSIEGEEKLISALEKELQPVLDEIERIDSYLMQAKTKHAKIAYGALKVKYKNLSKELKEEISDICMFYHKELSNHIVDKNHKKKIIGFKRRINQIINDMKPPVNP